MRVVHDQQPRAVLGQAGRHQVQRVQHREPFGGRTVVQRPLRGDRQERGLGGAVQQPVAVGRGQRGQRRLQQLPGEAERELLLDLAAAGGQQVKSVVGRAFRGGPEQRGLAASGRALDDHRAAPARCGVGHRRVQGVQVGVSFQE